MTDAKTSSKETGRRERIGQFIKNSVQNDTNQAIALFFAPTRALVTEFTHSMKQLKTMSAHKAQRGKKQVQENNHA